MIYDILKSYEDNIKSNPLIQVLVNIQIEACCNKLLDHIEEFSRHDANGDISFIMQKVKEDLLEIIGPLIIYANSNAKIKEIIEFLDRNIKGLSDPRKIERLRLLFSTFKKIKLGMCSDTYKLTKALGWFYRLLRQFDISKYYFELCKQEVTITAPDEQKLAEVYEDLGYMHLAKNECELALEYFENSLAILDIIGKATNNIKSKYYLNFARCHQLNNSWSPTLDYYLKIVHSLKNENYHQVIGDLLDDCNIDLGELPAVRAYIDKINTFYESYRNPNIRVIEHNEVNLQRSDRVDSNDPEIPIPRRYNRHSGVELSIIELDPSKKWITKRISSRSTDPILSAFEEYKHLKQLERKGSQFLRVNRRIDRTNESPMIIEIEMEYCKQTLNKFFNEKIVDKEKVFEILNDLSHGFLIMKQERLVHGDIKPDNILVSSEDKVKIGDLGSVQKIEETSRSIRFDPNPGTIIYLSPEMYIFSRLNCGYILCNPSKSDVFSLGLTILSCIGVSILGLNDMLGEGALTPSQILFLEEVNRNGCPIIGTLITEDQEWYFLRTKLLEMKIEEALQSIRSEYKYLDSILQKMLVVDYEKRCNFDELTRLIRTSSIELA